MYGHNGYSSVTKNPVTSIYTVSFAGKNIETTVTDKAAVMDAWVRGITSTYGRRTGPTVVGLDVEWRPHQCSWLTNKSATLQLCIDDKCLIIQLYYVDSFPQSLKVFLMNPDFIFVGIEVGDDIAKITNEYDLRCNKRADIRDVAKTRWPRRFSRPGLKDLAREIARLRMEKPLDVCRSNWDARVLSDRQVEYGCIDAFASYMVGYKLLIEKLGR